MIREKPTSGVSGLAMLFALLAAIAGSIVLFSQAVALKNGGLSLLWGLACLVAIVMLFGLFMVNPNEGRVLQLFGDYVGTVKRPGLRWANPFLTKKRVSLRVRNFETASRLKVNDVDGNPIEMSSVVAWKVVDTAQAIFQVDNYEKYVTVAAEAAMRKLAMSYPYDSHEDNQQLSLRGSPNEIGEHLRSEMQERLAVAGVEVIEARISNLSYAPEIAQAMLRRQQASAVIAARQKIVDGSVGMVEMALERLSKKNIVHLDEERKAAMVSNLLVVLCSESSTQPIINTGTLYQ
jgi:regulator of protease activity HflC (stomatin/prohibitin superfamily)